MTAVVSPIPLAQQQHLLLHDVSWQFYEHLLREVGDRPIRVTYDHGKLEIMSPLPKHEKWGNRIGRMIELLAIELDIPMEPLGSTTFKREDLQKGLEPDECYYIQNAAAVRGKDELDLPFDPPPDLAIEVDITSRSIKREPIYAALGIPELWRFADRRLSVLELDLERKYRPIPRSNVFPFLPIETFSTFLLRLESEEQTAVLREFRDWIKTLNS
jgi:Uma2 family endonuclease